MAASAHRARTLLLGLAVVTGLFLAACDEEPAPPDPTPTVTATFPATQTVTPTVAPISYEPAPDAECDAILGAVESRLVSGTFERGEEAFATAQAGVTGRACTLLITGTAATLDSPAHVAAVATGVLAEAGWIEDGAFAADGPAGTETVYRSPGKLALVSAQAAPAEGTTCPEDQPISACFDTLDPELIGIAAIVAVAAAAP